MAYRRPRRGLRLVGGLLVNIIRIMLLPIGRIVIGRVRIIIGRGVGLRMGGLRIGMGLRPIG